MSQRRIAMLVLTRAQCPITLAFKFSTRLLLGSVGGPMDFANTSYFVLLAVCCGMVAALPRLRNPLLLLVSFGFYASYSPVYALLLATLMVFSFAAALAIERDSLRAGRGLLLAVALALCISPLLWFKYIGHLIASGSGSGTLIIPIGLSFYTFVIIGYLIDVYLGVVTPEVKLVRYGLFVSLFTRLTAGPIERASHFLPQLDEPVCFDAERILRGVRLIVIGLALKLGPGTALLGPVDEVYAHAGQAEPMEALLATMVFLFQAYADFAGYSLIAIGSGKLLGFETVPNFRQPFLSASVPEFWRNWHISFFGWLRDYVFTPIRVALRRHDRASIIAGMMIAFFVAGIWHGAGLTFVVFGLVQGVVMAAATLTGAARGRVWHRIGIPLELTHALRIPATFVLLSVTFIFFRANSFADALHIYGQLFSYHFVVELGHVIAGTAGFTYMHLSPAAVLWIAIIIIGDLIARYGRSLHAWPTQIIATLNLACAVVILHGVLASQAIGGFMYFKF